LLVLQSKAYTRNSCLTVCLALVHVLQDALQLGYQPWVSCLQQLLLAKRGSGHTKWKTTCSEPQEFTSVRGRHSAKPEEIRDIVRDFFQVDHRLELWARGNCPPDWDCWFDLALLHEATSRCQ